MAPCGSQAKRRIARGVIAGITCFWWSGGFDNGAAMERRLGATNAGGTAGTCGPAPYSGVCVGQVEVRCGLKTESGGTPYKLKSWRAKQCKVRSNSPFSALSERLARLQQKLGVSLDTAEEVRVAPSSSVALQQLLGVPLQMEIEGEIPAREAQHKERSRTDSIEAPAEFLGALQRAMDHLHGIDIHFDHGNEETLLQLQTSIQNEFSSFLMIS